MNIFLFSLLKSSDKVSWKIWAAELQDTPAGGRTQNLCINHCTKLLHRVLRQLEAEKLCLNDAQKIKWQQTCMSVTLKLFAFAHRAGGGGRIFQVNFTVSGTFCLFLPRFLCFPWLEEPCSESLFTMDVKMSPQEGETASSDLVEQTHPSYSSLQAYQPFLCTPVRSARTSRERADERKGAQWFSPILITDKCLICVSQ